MTASPSARRPPDLDPDAISSALGTRRIGRRVLVRSEVVSTMDDLGGLARAGEPEGTVVVADHQTGGRGRLGRGWAAPPGTALLVSILFRPPIPPERLPQVPMAVALGALAALDALLPGDRRAALKWPNDILVDGAKIAGLLAEVQPGPPGTPRPPAPRPAPSAGAPSTPPVRPAFEPAPCAPVAIVVGLGLNVSQSDGDLPPGATSVAALGIEPPSRDDLAAVLLAAVDHCYAELLAGASLVGPWSARLDTLGRLVVATGTGSVARGQVRGASPGAGQVVRGRAVGVAPDGALRIAMEGDGVVTVHAGDVTLAGSRLTGDADSDGDQGTARAAS